MTKRMIEIVCSDDLKVLNRITSILSFRGYNIDSLSSCRLNTSNKYKIHIELDYSIKIVNSMIKLIEKIVEVIEVRDVTSQVAINRQPILLKLKECI